MALLTKPRVRHTVAVLLVSTESDEYLEAEACWPEQVIGTDECRGDRDTVLGAICEDLEALREAGLPELKSIMPGPIASTENSVTQLPASRRRPQFGMLE
ncbi:MAG: hypothetical protein EXR28_02445 [Betaproteobacteria bacterium]|nr:hypothetical protein [Betaproteobacteria bacterium]